MPPVSIRYVLRHQLFLIQLLAGAKAGILDLDVYVRLKARHTDQVAGQGVDLNRAAHVQDKDLATPGIGVGQLHQAHRLRNRLQGKK